MKAKIVTLTGDASGEASLKKSVFGVELRTDILHRVVNWQLANRQAGTHKTKNRSEVRGSSKKLFRQKGTGNARSGNKKSPHKRGGGVAFGPVVRSHGYSLPKKIRAFGLRVALSSKQNSGKLFVLKDEKLTNIKTSVVAKAFDKLEFKSVLILAGEQPNDNLKKAVSNIKNVDILPVQGANVYDILRRENLIVTEEALKKLEERLDV